MADRTQTIALWGRPRPAGKSTRGFNILAAAAASRCHYAGAELTVSLLTAPEREALAVGLGLEYADDAELAERAAHRAAELRLTLEDLVASMEVDRG